MSIQAFKCQTKSITFIVQIIEFFLGERKMLECGSVSTRRNLTVFFQHFFENLKDRKKSRLRLLSLAAKQEVFFLRGDKITYKITAVLSLNQPARQFAQVQCRYPSAIGEIVKRANYFTVIFMYCNLQVLAQTTVSNCFAVMSI